MEQVHDRPPKEEYWDYIVERRDLLVPQDVRERKGSFFTPQIWVELSQKYLTDVLGENWQDEYTIWDCAAGTGNLLNGLTNKYNIWASTLDKQDVEVMRDRIKNGANLLEDHVFQFDFLNDEFTKLPAALQKIINDPERRKKLVIYINPPYAEATSSKTISNTDSSHKKSVADSRTKERYGALLNQGAKELFVQFIFRAYMEMQGIYIANFSKIKTLQGAHYKELRQNFSPKLEKLFIVPSYTFDNVTGQFPIGFFIWNTQVKDIFSKVTTDIYDEGASFIGTKTILVTPDKNIKDWLRKYSTTSNRIGYLVRGSADVQNNSIVFITIEPSKSVLNASNASQISSTNLIENAIFLSARKVIAKTWINDRDQYLYPNDGWQSDTDFQNDCLAYTLFNNNIQSQHGTNHWIPFTEHEVNAREKFDSNFMTQFIQGKLKQDAKPTLFGELELRVTPLVFSIQAKAVLDAGRALWTHYHQQPQCNVNASLYDIREHFQGRNDKGKMNNKSTDEAYTTLIKNLRDELKLLEKSIEPKIYEYGFLKK